MKSFRILTPFIFIFSISLIMFACQAASNIEPVNKTTNPKITYEARALYNNLDQLRQNHVLFGHQDDLAYGVNWINEPGRSDVKEVTGSYPAVYGWEIGDLEMGAEQNLDKVNFEDMKGWIREGYLRGGVITIAWHMNNPVTGGNAWDTDGRAISQILPGAEKHDLFVEWLNTFAGFVSDLKVEDGETNRPAHIIPILFRPYHEHTGSWFWWGADQSTPEEYKALWHFTVDYLRNEKQLHNLLFVYSPDRFESKEHYLERYPGDDYVDILGYDDYGNVQSIDSVPTFTNQLKMVVEMAEERGKIPVLSETGSETLPIETWFTDVLLAGIRGDETASRIAYALVWRNAHAETDRPNHYYAPYPGHPTAPNMVEFKNDPFVLFEDELPNLYE